MLPKSNRTTTLHGCTGKQKFIILIIGTSNQKRNECVNCANQNRRNGHPAFDPIESQIIYHFFDLFYCVVSFGVGVRAILFATPIFAPSITK